MSTLHHSSPARRGPDVAGLLLADLRNQRDAYFRSPKPGYRQSKQDRLQLRRMLLDNSEQIFAAINEDDGNRSRHELVFAEIIPAVAAINDALKHLRRWMRAQKRHVDSTRFPGCRNRIIPQLPGVVGLIVPWNCPLNLAISQLVAVVSAGNRAIVKMPENSVALSRLLGNLSNPYVPDDKLIFYEESGGVGITSKLRPVFYRPRFSPLKYLWPPYGKLATRVFDFILKVEG